MKLDIGNELSRAYMIYRNIRYTTVIGGGYILVKATAANEINCACRVFVPAVNCFCES